MSPSVRPKLQAAKTGGVDLIFHIKPPVINKKSDVTLSSFFIFIHDQRSVKVSGNLFPCIFMRIIPKGVYITYR